MYTYYCNKYNKKYILIQQILQVVLHVLTARSSTYYNILYRLCLQNDENYIAYLARLVHIRVEKKPKCFLKFSINRFRFQIIEIIRVTNTERKRKYKKKKLRPAAERCGCRLNE